MRSLRLSEPGELEERQNQADVRRFQIARWLSPLSTDAIEQATGQTEENAALDRLSVRQA